MDTLSNFAKDRKLRLFLLVLCSLPPWNDPQHQILLFPKMIVPLPGEWGAPQQPPVLQRTRVPRRLRTTWVKGDKTTRAAHPLFTNIKPRSCWQWMIFCFERFLTTTLTITTTIYNNKFPGVHNNPPPRVQAGAQRALYNRSGEHWHQDCCHPFFPYMVWHSHHWL